MFHFLTFQKMVMKYHRNKNKDANDDIAELTFLCSEDKIQITYHTEEERITYSTREFLKPHNWDEKGATLSFTPDMHQTFQVTMYCKLKQHFISLIALLNTD